MHINSIYITTYQERTWGRLYVSFEKEGQQYYAFKNFLNFSEHNYIGTGNVDNEPCFSWFVEQNRHTFSVEEVIKGNADYLYLTPEKYRVQYGTPSILLKRLLIDIYSNNLTPVEHRRGWYDHVHIPEVTLSELHITKDFKQIVFEDYFTEFQMEPLMKTLYVFYLKHKEGVKRTDLSDFKSELQQIYTQITEKSDLEKVTKSIDSLIDNSGKSFDEKVSKIKKQLVDLLGGKLAKHYYIVKNENELYQINLPLEKIKFD